MKRNLATVREEMKHKISGVADNVLLAVAKLVNVNCPFSPTRTDIAEAP